MTNNKIIICGSHFSPAWALAEKLIKEKKVKIYIVGRQRSLEGDDSRSLEHTYLHKLKVPYYSIANARLQRHLTFWTIPSLAKFPIAIFQSLLLLFKIKPALVVSFGGYTALPVCLAARVWHIPVITHEQTPIMGIANRLIAGWARVTCLTYPQTKFVPLKSKTIVTGNPVRASILVPKIKTGFDFGNPRLPLVFITGGSQGARSINQLIAGILIRLLSSFRVIHQCGSADQDSDFRQLTAFKSRLPEKLRSNYLLLESVDPDDFGQILKKSTLVVGRAGANTVAELGITKTPAVLIPLPWSAENEQLENAKILQSAGLAKILPQDKLTSETLLETVVDQSKHFSANRPYGGKISDLFIRDGADRVMAIIYKELNIK